MTIVRVENKLDHQRIHKFTIEVFESGTKLTHLPLTPSVARFHAVVVALCGEVRDAASAPRSMAVVSLTLVEGVRTHTRAKVSRGDVTAVTRVGGGVREGVILALDELADAVVRDTVGV